MKLLPSTIAAHQQRQQNRYPAHTLAPDTAQPELDLRPADRECKRCQRQCGWCDPDADPLGR